MAKIIVSTSLDFARDETKSELIIKCCDSWYGRHKSSKAMKQGSLNEIPLAQQLERLDWLDCFFDCGIIEVRNSPEVAVSADGFSLITVQAPVDPTSASDSDSEVGSLTALTQPKIVEAVVEMKTRLSDDTTIRRATLVARKHGVHVQCKYNDEVFKDCVPSENRLQVMHQVYVTGLRWSVFVTSKVTDCEGSIVQTVVIHFDETEIDDYEQILLPRAKELVGFLHNADLIERGHLIDEDFPSWFPEEARYLVKSRYQLFSAHERKIKKCGNSELFDDDDDIQYTTIAPVHTFKSSFQSSYNCGKWGLDKSTEFALSLLPSKVCMETKYVFRGLAGPLVNLW
jgi:hypothetical protein